MAQAASPRCEMFRRLASMKSTGTMRGEQRGKTCDARGNLSGSGRNSIGEVCVKIRHGDARNGSKRHSVVGGLTIGITPHPALYPLRTWAPPSLGAIPPSFGEAGLLSLRSVSSTRRYSGFGLNWDRQDDRAFRSEAGFFRGRGPQVSAVVFDHTARDREDQSQAATTLIERGRSSGESRRHLVLARNGHDRHIRGALPRELAVG